MARKRYFGICVYCGEHRPVTRDHVPPKSFFAPPPPPDLATVPSCEACNHGFSLHVEYFRSRAVWHDAAAEHPDARALLPSVVRGFGMLAKQPFKASFLRSLRAVAVRTPAGVVLPDRKAMEVESDRLRRLAGQIVRGLYFVARGEALPSSVECGIIDEDTVQAQPVGWRRELEETILAPLMTEPLIDAGRGVLRHRFALDQTNPHAGVWLLEFYEGIRFLAFLMPPDAVYDA